MNDAEFFAPWRLVAAFADGSRLLFDGLTEEQAYDAMVAAQEQHGDIGYWNRVTDQNYEDGRYYKTIPEPPAVHIVDFTGYDGPLDENGFPVGLPDEIARYAKEQGAAPMLRRSSSSATPRLILRIRTKSNHEIQKARRVHDLTGLWC